MTTNLSQTTTSAPVAEDKTYAVFRDFNTVTFEGGVQYTELKANDNGEYVSVTVITNLKDGEKGVAVRFTSSNRILKLAKAGHLMPGRRVHITGSLVEFKNAYTDANGEVKPLERPQIQLQGVSLMLGAKPKSARA